MNQDTASVTALIIPYIPYSKVEQFSLQVFSFYQLHIKFTSIAHTFPTRNYNPFFYSNIHRKTFIN